MNNPGVPQAPNSINREMPSNQENPSAGVAFQAPANNIVQEQVATQAQPESIAAPEVTQPQLKQIEDVKKPELPITIDTVNRVEHVLKSEPDDLAELANFGGIYELRQPGSE